MLPAGLDDSIARFRDRYPDPLATGFIMMRFTRGRPHAAILDAVRSAFTANETTLLRADDYQFHPDLFTNILTYLYGCGFGVAIFDRIEADEFNPNVSLEVGYMMALQKPICFLKDRTLRALPTDVVSRLYFDFDAFSPADGLAEHARRWLEANSLCATCRQCNIYVDLDVSQWVESTLYSVATGVGMLVRGAGHPKFRGVGTDEETGHSILKYDASTVFIERLKGMLSRGELTNLAGINILKITSDADGVREPRVNDVYMNLDTGDILVQFCFLQQFSGMEVEATEARAVLPPLTNNPAECAVYITEHEGAAYFHSNFVQSGRVYPTKFIARRHNGLRTAYPLVVGLDHSKWDADDRHMLNHVRKVRYLINRRMTLDGRVPKLDTFGATRLEIVDV